MSQMTKPARIVCREGGSSREEEKHEHYNILGRNVLLKNSKINANRSQDRKKTHTAPMPIANAATPQATDFVLGSI
jgi:hypothetical protein